MRGCGRRSPQAGVTGRLTWNSVSGDSDGWGGIDEDPSRENLSVPRLGISTQPTSLTPQWQQLPQAVEEAGGEGQAGGLPFIAPIHLS